MQNLSPEQAQALWAAGGFIVISDLPEGSEYGIDGVFHTTLSFSGTKFLPPGIHLISWSAPTSITRKPSLDTGAGTRTSDVDTETAPAYAGGGPGAIPLRQALLLHTASRSRHLLRYSPQLETLVLDKDAVLSDEHLKSLDKSMAPYPFHALEGWKRLTSAIDADTLRRVLGEDGRVDGMTRVDGEVDEVDIKRSQGEAGGTGREQEEQGRQVLDMPKHQIEEEPLRFTLFDPKRSWRDGAVGEEVTRYSRDKSWLLGDVLRRLEYEPVRLIAKLQLAFILVLNLSSFGSLQVYKRIIQIICHATDIHLLPAGYIPASVSSSSNDAKPRRPTRLIRQLYTSFIQTLSAQLVALPEGVFDTELPELDVWLIGEIDSLRSNLRGAVQASAVRAAEGASVWAGEGDKAVQARRELEEAWTGLVQAVNRFKWDIEPLQLHDVAVQDTDEEDSEEEGEYAPVVVDI